MQSDVSVRLRFGHLLVADSQWRRWPVAQSRVVWVARAVRARVARAVRVRVRAEVGPVVVSHRLDLEQGRPLAPLARAAEPVAVLVCIVRHGSRAFLA